MIDPFDIHPPVWRRSAEFVAGFGSEGFCAEEDGHAFLPWLIALDVDMRKLTILADFLFNRIVKHDGKAHVLRPYHRTRHAWLFVEGQHRETKADPLPMFDRSPGANIDASRTYVTDQIPIRSWLDGVFGTKQGDVARMLASISNVFHFPFTLSRNWPEHLNVTTHLGFNIRSSPVAGFRPFRSFLSFTQNLPKPETKRSSPDAKVSLISAIRDSVVAIDWFLRKPSSEWICSTISCFVKAIQKLRTCDGGNDM